MSRAQLTSTVEQNSAGAAAPVVGAKNFLANGGMDIWQRGTSFSLAAASTNVYIADRWTMACGTNQATTISRQATSDTTNLPFIQYCLRYQRNSGQTGTAGMFLAQCLETLTSIPLAGKTITVSFYARAGANYSATSNILGATISSGTGTDQNIFSGITGQTLPGSLNATLTTTWQRFSLSASIPSNSTESQFYFGFNPTGTAGTNDYFEVTGVQLEVGSVATPFARAGGTLQGELSLCQRYYWRPSPTAAYAQYGLGWASTSTNHVIQVQMPTSMRALPTSIDYSNLGITDHISASISASSMAIDSNYTNQTCIVLNVATGATFASRTATALINLNNTAGYLGISAEL
jgi:hypothetical protein